MGLNMTKTFREILAEKDDEFVYYVRSTADIHNEDRFERMRMSFMPYRIKTIERDSYRPISRDNKTFPDEPNSATYSVKVITGLKVPKEFIHTLAPDVHIHMAHLKIEGDQDVELVNKPGTVSSSEAQSLVGQKRIAEFIKELQADRRKREKETVEREVYESFYTTHRGIEDIVKKPVRNGYYMVEASRYDGKTIFKVEGPFDARPDKEKYCDHIRATRSEVIAEDTSGDMYGVQVLVEGEIIVK